jgi:hypothetical protein
MSVRSLGESNLAGLPGLKAHRQLASSKPKQAAGGFAARRSELPTMLSLSV